MNKPENLEKNPIHINHKDLKNFGDGAYKSECPVCDDGLLLMRRNMKTLKLDKHDICVSCGQRVIYDDLNHLV